MGRTEKKGKRGGSGVKEGCEKGKKAKGDKAGEGRNRMGRREKAGVGGGYRRRNNKGRQTQKGRKEDEGKGWRKGKRPKGENGQKHTGEKCKRG